MTGADLETIQMLFPDGAEKSFLLRELEEPTPTVWRDVPDPIGLGGDVYEVCTRTIKNALPSVLAFGGKSELGPTWRGRRTSPYLMSDLPDPIQPEAGSTSSFGSGGSLRRVDPEIFDAIAAEEKRQRENIELIASENFTSHAVMEAQGSVLTNKYAEGYPKKRWYGGCENGGVVEQLAIARAPPLFRAHHANFHPHPPPPPTLPVYFPLLTPPSTPL